MWISQLKCVSVYESVWISYVWPDSVWHANVLTSHSIRNIWAKYTHIIIPLYVRTLIRVDVTLCPFSYSKVSILDKIYPETSEFAAFLVLDELSQKMVTCPCVDPVKGESITLDFEPWCQGVYKLEICWLHTMCTIPSEKNYSARLITESLKLFKI